MRHDRRVNAPPLTRAKPDATVVGALEVARTELVAEVGGTVVGEHLGVQPEAERVATHFFACTQAGYSGWRWSVTLVRASRAKVVTVDEIVLLPGDGSITAPQWVPYKERIKPGDLSPGDLLPVEQDDERLVPTYSFGEDDLDDDERLQIRSVVRELGLGRVRTLSPEGIDQAAERWYDSDAGPAGAIAQAASQSCDSCGFLLRLRGSLEPMFGVCANGSANDDGRVVSLDHGCGAHSEVALAKRHLPAAMPEHVMDTYDAELESF